MLDWRNENRIQMPATKVTPKFHNWYLSRDYPNH